MAALDITGHRFGKRVVQWPVGIKGKCIFWLCVCDCGKLSIKRKSELVSGKHNSCMSCARTKHGEARTLKYKMWGAAKHRAKKDGVAFDISFEDIKIPERCPLLEIPLIRRKGSGTDSGSPTLDKIVPELGYVKGNIRVISAKANLMKNNSTIQEMSLLLKNWRLLNE